MTHQNPLKVAIAGTSQVGQYLIEELRAYGHDIVVLTRSVKEGKDYEQRETDYSVSSLVSVLHDRDALVSTVADFTDPSKSTQTHLNMIEALQQSKSCKMFIPSAWTSNEEDYPDQMMLLKEVNKTLHHALQAAKSIKWTIICIGWFMDYLATQSNRYLRSNGPLFAVDHDAKQFTIYGPGTQLVNFTAVRDVARATASLLASSEPWEEYTYMQGEQISWRDLYAILKQRDPSWTSRNQSLGDTVELLADKASSMGVLQGNFEIASYSGALEFPKERVERDRSRHFRDVKFRDINGLLDQAAQHPEAIL